MSVNVKLGNNTISGVNSIKLKNADTPENYIEFAPQEYQYYKNYIHPLEYGPVNSNAFYRQRTLSGTKVDSSYVVCSLDVTSCDVYAMGRKMNNGERITAVGDVCGTASSHTSFKYAAMCQPPQASINNYRGTWCSNSTGATTLYWYLNNNTLFLLSYGQYLDVIYSNTSSGYPIMIYGVTIVGNPVLTNGSMTVGTRYTQYEGSCLKLVTEANRLVDSSAQLLPKGLAGQSACLGVKFETEDAATLSLVTTTLVAA